MQTLGLSGEAKPSDGRLKSIFWPTVQNAWDVDYLARQGLWICVLIAVLQITVAVTTGAPIVIAIGAMEALAFLVGGFGVRLGNWPAAAMVFSIFMLDLLYGIAEVHPPGILMIIAAGILLSNVRATFLASRWKPTVEDEDKPSRFNETLADKFADQLPAKAWPLLRTPFFALATLLLLMSAIGLCKALMQRMCYGIR